jgi:hypothetical protein
MMTAVVLLLHLLHKGDVHPPTSQMLLNKPLVQSQLTLLLKLRYKVLLANYMRMGVCGNSL